MRRQPHLDELGRVLQHPFHDHVDIYNHCQADWHHAQGHHDHVNNDHDHDHPMDVPVSHLLRLVLLMRLFQPIYDHKTPTGASVTPATRQHHSVWTSRLNLMFPVKTTPASVRTGSSARRVRMETAAVRYLPTPHCTLISCSSIDAHHCGWQLCVHCSWWPGCRVHARRCCQQCFPD